MSQWHVKRYVHRSVMIHAYNAAENKFTDIGDDDHCKHQLPKLSARHIEKPQEICYCKCICQPAAIEAVIIQEKIRIQPENQRGKDQEQPSGQCHVGPGGIAVDEELGGEKSFQWLVLYLSLQK